MLPFSPTGLESSPLPGSYALIEESLERNLPRVLMKRKPGVQVDREARPLLEAVQQDAKPASAPWTALHRPGIQRLFPCQGSGLSLLLRQGVLVSLPTPMPQSLGLLMYSGGCLLSWKLKDEGVQCPWALLKVLDQDPLPLMDLYLLLSLALPGMVCSCCRKSSGGTGIENKHEDHKIDPMAWI